MNQSDSEKLLKELKYALSGEKLLPKREQDLTYQKLLKQTIDELENKIIGEKWTL